MSSKWDEQEAFETNKFKVGDQVCTYSGERAIEFIVDHVTHKLVWPPFEGKSTRICYHFKQCRLLKKRGRREIYLARKFPGSPEELYFEFPKDMHDVIEFREVFDE